MERALQDSEREYWEQRLGPDVPLNSVGYHGLSDAYVAWLYRVRAFRFRQTAARFARQDVKVLDIGSGGGFYADAWQKFGVRDVTASDLTEASLRAIARRLPGVQTVRFDIGDPSAALPLQTYDAISCMDVLHHLMDDSTYQQAMNNCAKLLKPGGALIFTENFLHGPAFRGSHSFSRPLIQIERALRSAGLRIASRRPMFVLMNNPVDSYNKSLRLYWRGVSFLCENAFLGQLLGAALYPVELTLTSVLNEGPSTEICVAIKDNI